MVRIEILHNIAGVEIWANAKTQEVTEVAPGRQWVRFHTFEGLSTAGAEAYVNALRMRVDGEEVDEVLFLALFQRKDPPEQMLLVEAVTFSKVLRHA